MKRATVCGDAGAEVGFSLVLTARSLVGPGVPRAPRIATASAHLRFRLRGLHASVLTGDVSWKSSIRAVAWTCMPPVSLRAPGSRSGRRSPTNTMPTTTRGLLELAEWLTAHGCTHVAMEATGVYWNRSGMCSKSTSLATQERRERCDVDRRPAGARPDPQQLCPARAGSGAARPHAQPATARSRNRAACVADSEDPRGR
jgi:hypothetical protein